MLTFWARPLLPCLRPQPLPWRLHGLGLSMSSLAGCSPLDVRDIEMRSKRQPTSRFRGVRKRKENGRWESKVTLDGRRYHLGCFRDERAAALAYDAKLRELLKSPLAVKRLNFPSQEELKLLAKASASADFNALQRARHVETYGDSHKKSAMAISLVAKALEDSTLTMRWLGEGTVAGAAVQDAMSLGDQWMGLVIKSTARTSQSHLLFSKAKGCAGLVIICINLTTKEMWVIPGNSVDVEGIAISPRGKWDVYKCSLADLSTKLSSYLESSTVELRPLNVWETPKSKTQQVEASCQQILEEALLKAGLRPSPPLVQYSQVDLLVNGSIRVQMKVTGRFVSSIGSFTVPLQRQAGKVNGERIYKQYETSDFDCLVALMIEADQVVGAFVFPVGELASRGLVGRRDKRGGSLTLYPPWSQPRSESGNAARSWQQQYFVDISSKNYGPEESLRPPSPAERRQQQHLKSLVLACERDWRSFAE